MSKAKTKEQTNAVASTVVGDMLHQLVSKPYVKECEYDHRSHVYTITMEDGSKHVSADGEGWYLVGSSAREVLPPWEKPTPPNTGSNVKPKEDIIGHPNHYCEGRKYEPKDVIRDWNLNFNLGNAVKYISRNGRKDGNSALQDLKKARQYLDFEIAYLEKEQE